MKIEDGVIYFEKLTEADPSKFESENFESQHLTANVESFVKSNAPGAFKESDTLKEVCQAMRDIAGRASSVCVMQ